MKQIGWCELCSFGSTISGSEPSFRPPQTDTPETRSNQSDTGSWSGADGPWVGPRVSFCPNSRWSPSMSYWSLDVRTIAHWVDTPGGLLLWYRSCWCSSDSSAPPPFPPLYRASRRCYQTSGYRKILISPAAALCGRADTALSLSVTAAVVPHSLALRCTP